MLQRRNSTVSSPWLTISFVEYLNNGQKENYSVQRKTHNESRSDLLNELHNEQTAFPESLLKNGLIMCTLDFNFGTGFDTRPRCHH